jgi:hypothetical protein
MDQHPLLTYSFFAAMINMYFIKEGREVTRPISEQAWIARGIP